MRHSDIRDDGDIRFCDSCKRLNFARMIHAYFPDGCFVVSRCCQYRKWQADMVVEISLSLGCAELSFQTAAVRSLVLVLPLLPVIQVAFKRS